MKLIDNMKIPLEFSKWPVFIYIMIFGLLLNIEEKILRAYKIILDNCENGAQNFLTLADGPLS